MLRNLGPGYQRAGQITGEAPAVYSCLQRGSSSEQPIIDDGERAGGSVQREAQSFSQPKFEHDFSRVRVHSAESLRSSPLESPPLRHVYAQRRPNRVSPVTRPSIPPVPVTPAPATPAPAAPAQVQPTAQPTLTLSNNSFIDTGGTSRKPIQFDVTVPPGLNATDFAIVNKIKGQAVRNARGDAHYVTMDQILVPYYFTNWRVDSPDHDPIYASLGTSRWNYTPTSTGFTTSDDPGPARSNEPNSFWDLCFKTELHRLSSVPPDYSAPLPAPLDTKHWTYYVRVDQAGRFSHTRPRGEPDRCAG